MERGDSRGRSDVERRDEQWRPALWFIPCNFLPHYLPLGFQHIASHLFVFSIFLLPSREYPFFFFFLSTYVPAEQIQSGI